MRLICGYRVVILPRFIEELGTFCPVFASALPVVTALGLLYEMRFQQLLSKDRPYGCQSKIYLAACLFK